MGMLYHRKSVLKAANKVNEGAEVSAPKTVEPTPEKPVEKATKGRKTKA